MADVNSPSPQDTVSRREDLLLFQTCWYYIPTTAQATDFYLSKRKWIPIPAFGVLFGSVQGRDWWHNNSKTKAKVGGVLPGFSLTPLPSPSLNKPEGREGA